MRSARHAIVVGAGVVGLSTAVALRRRGVRVTVLERGAPLGEASAAAAGMLAPLIEHDSGPNLAFAARARDETIAFVRELASLTGIVVPLTRPGIFAIAATPEERAALERRAAALASAGHDVEVLSGASAREAIPGLAQRAIAALRAPRDCALDANLYGAALRAAAERLGVEVRAGVAVTNVEEHSRRVVGVTYVGPDGGSRLDGTDVVVCAGAFSSLLPALELGGFVYPVRGQVVQLQGPPGVLQHVLFGAGGYLVPRDDGRVLIGATMEDVGFDRQVAAAGVRAMLEVASQLMPALGGHAFSRAWCGFRPATRDGMPLMGAGAVEGLWFNAGHHRNGILLAATAGAGLADEMTGGAIQLDRAPFAPAGRLSSHLAPRAAPRAAGPTEGGAAFEERA